MRIALITLLALGVFAFANAPTGFADHWGNNGCCSPCGVGYQHQAGPGHYVGRYPCAPGTYATSGTYASSPGMTTTYSNTTYSTPASVTETRTYPYAQGTVHPSTTYTHGTVYPSTYTHGYRAYPYGTYHRPYRRSFLGIRW